MLILADNDVTGAVAVLRRLVESEAWREYAEILELRFLSFEDLGLPRNAPDRDVWLACQAAGSVLIAPAAGRGRSAATGAVPGLSGSRLHHTDGIRLG